MYRQPHAPMVGAAAAPGFTALCIAYSSTADRKCARCSFDREEASLDLIVPPDANKPYTSASVHHAPCNTSRGFST
jgi:hypothetical protein